MSKAVFCQAVPSYDQAAVNAAVETLFAACACCAALGGSTKVLIKPNLLAKHVPEHAVTTHPAVLRAAILALQARGVTHITVADSSGGLYTPGAMKSIYKVSGLAAVCEETGAALFTDCTAKTRKTNGVRVREFNMITPVHEADFILNLPKLKTHAMTGLTCAVKNIFGVIPGLEKAEMHMRFSEKGAFGEMLTDLCEAVKSNMTLVDGVVGMEGDGPAGGTPKQVGVLMASENPYSIDLAACRIIGIAPMDVPYLNAAQRRGLCDDKIDPALLLLEPLAAAPVAHYKLPASYRGVDFSANVPRPIRWLVPGAEKLIAPHPVVRSSACIGCGKCAEICPANTILIKNKTAHIVPKACIRCFCCHEMCPVKAIDIKRFGIFRHDKS